MGVRAIKVTQRQVHIGMEMFPKSRKIKAVLGSQEFGTKTGREAVFNVHIH